ncbi:uncharacterized protein LOC117178477 [Belonocnema kinseyi]|uniref:uncharacterized protein LOC117178477 n=1 Tax=Belonocnema kinseyi TaxID=2817044 RepID=UPI00143DBB49|nr:uncharacterized protein LOC117178477 [Belonocnema kinseyi]
MENFGKIAEFIKQQLATSNSESRNELISGLLETLREINQEKFVMQLVYKGVISDLIKNIEPENKRDGLKCLEIIVKADSFYTNNLTDEAILGITKLRLIESAEEAATAVNILNTIVTK